MNEEMWQMFKYVGIITWINLLLMLDIGLIVYILTIHDFKDDKKVKDKK